MLSLEIIGNLGSDAEIKNFGGREYASFNVAHSERNKETQQAITTWVSVLYYNTGILPYLTTGTKVFVRGNVKIKAYTAKDGTLRSSINVFANEVTLCGSKDKEQHQHQQTQAPAPSPSPGPDPFATMPQQNDDIPF